ncbi:host-nuclease inhibitor Gam family protein [Lysinibacillus capsici]|uniref:host-nuclease inhibitor Gam family protein n=1 Tax=Lysinibacillus capsici TaxID=2115968 RepID=UPI003D704A42
MNQLQEKELFELYEQDPQEKEIFIIKDISGLNWVFRKINAINAKLNEIKSLANSERERIDAWEKKESSVLESDIEFFEQKITEYHSQVLADDPEQKSIVTPYGKVKSITYEAQPEKLNEEAISEYVMANELPFLEKDTSPKLQWAELKKTLRVVQKDNEQIVVDVNGQAVPGVTVKPRTTIFKVEVDN